MTRKSLSAADRWPAIAFAALAAGLVSFSAPGSQGASAEQGANSQGTGSPAATAPSRAAAAPLPAEAGSRLLSRGGPKGIQTPQKGKKPGAQAPLKKATGPELAKEYADWKINALTRSSGSEARTSLRALRDRVRMTAEASPSEARLVDLLASIEVRLIIALMGAGDTEGVAKALAALEAGAAPDAARTAGTSNGAESIALSRSPSTPRANPQPGPVARARRAALSTPEVRALIDSRPSAGAGLSTAQETPRRPADAAIDRFVREAVARGAVDDIQQLGLRATPSLRDLSLAIDGQMQAPGSVDALALLLQIDPAKGLEIAAQMASTNDILVKSRVAVALQSARPLESHSMWRPSPNPRPGRADEPTSPHVTATITGLLAEPSVPPAMLSEFGKSLYSRGWIPKEIEAVMPDILGTYLGGNNAIHAGSAAMLKVALKHTDPKVRLAAVLSLHCIGELTATYPAASDPSVEVRQAMAWNLGPANLTYHVGSLPGDMQQRRVLPEVNADYEKALLTIFAADPSDSASEAAIGACRSLAEEDGTRLISKETLVKLAAVAKAPEMIGSVMAYATRFDEAIMRSVADVIMSGLLDATAESGGDSVAYFLASLATLDKPDLFWESLTKTQGMGLITPSAAPDVLDQVRMAAFRHPRRMGAALDWLNERTDPALWQRLYFAGNALPDVPVFVREFTVGFGTGHLEPFVQAFGRIPGADPQRLMPMNVRRLSGAMAERLLEDRTMTPEARIWLVKTLISRSQHQVSDPEKTTAAILDAYVAAGQAVGAEAHLGANGIDTSKFLSAALARADLKDQTLLELSVQIDAPEVMDAVLERFPPSTWSKLGKQPLLQGATAGIMRSDRPDRIELMAALVRVDMQLAITVVEEIRCKGRPEDFQLLEVVFESVHPESEAWDIALDAATNFLDDAAVELLLELARRPYDHKSSRSNIMAAVDIIQNWQAAQRRFTEGLAPAAARAGVIDELVQIIEDRAATVEARAAALKGLGHLHASDQLPRLIKALSDPDESIQEAARHALDSIDGADRR